MYYSTKDSWRFVRICLICENRLNLWKLAGFVIHDSEQIFLSQDLWSTIWYKSRIYFVWHGSNLFGVRIRDHDRIRIHVFTNLLYNSRNLNKLPVGPRWKPKWRWNKTWLNEKVEFFFSLWNYYTDWRNNFNMHCHFIRSKTTFIEMLSGVL